MPVTARVKRKVEEPSQFPEGFHRAILINAENHDTRNNSSIRLTFANGEWEHKEDLWLSSGAQARLTLITRRLGLIAGDGDGGDDDEPEVTYDDAIGREYVINIKHEKTQDDRIVTKIDYAGVWPLDHSDKKVKEFLETEYGKVAAAQAGEASPTTPSGGSAGGGSPSSNGGHTSANSANLDDI